MKRAILDRPVMWEPTPGCPYSAQCCHSGVERRCEVCIRNTRRRERDDYAPIPQEAI